MWRETVNYEAKYCVEAGDGYVDGWHSLKFFTISPEKFAELYIRVLDWWKKYEQ